MLESEHDTNAPETIDACSKIGFVWMVNAMLFEQIKALLVNCGTFIGQQELDNGVHADKGLFKEFASVCND